MTVGYEEAIIIISLAIFGLYAMIEELWHIKWHEQDTQDATIVLIVQNRESDIEHLIRSTCEYLDNRCELVIADVASTDNTRIMLNRLIQDSDLVRIVHADSIRQGITDSISIARGSIIHICDLVHRLDTDQCIDYLSRLAKIE